MKIPPLESIETQEQARTLAVEWQQWQSQQSMSYGELHRWQVFFRRLATKFNGLTAEFKENGII